MREELRDPLRLDHIKDAIERLIEFDKSCKLENIAEKDLRYYGVIHQSSRMKVFAVAERWNADPSAKHAGEMVGIGEAELFGDVVDRQGGVGEKSLSRHDELLLKILLRGDM